MSGFPLGRDFPRERFVQRAIERHFAARARIQVGHTDFACTDELGRRWLIEAKGETGDVGLDFRTVWGSFSRHPRSPGWILGLAMRDTPRFARQRDRTPAWVGSALGLHWLIVESNGAVIDTPEER